MIKKNIIILAALLFISMQLRAQAPQKFNYQAVCRDNAGNILNNQSVNLRLTLHDLLPNGAELYEETHTAITNAFGLVNVQVGSGTLVAGDFATVPWGSGEKHLEVELDLGSGYSAVGTTQLLSVPYALYAAQSGAGGGLPTGASGQTLRHDGATWIADDLLYNNGASVGVGTTSPAAFLDISSTLNGVLFPRMNTALRDDINAPAQSVVIFNTTTNCFETWLGTSWQKIYCGCTAAPAYPPKGSTNMSGLGYMLWSWFAVPFATGYKWNHADDFNTATDLGASNSFVNTQMNCGIIDTIYVWAYNECGHSASLRMINSSSACPCGGNSSFTDARDGTVYDVVSIGTQCWMKQNLKYDQTGFGNDFQNCYDPPTCSQFDMYYDWDAAMQGAASSNNSPSGVQGVCPVGWHLPSDPEWTTLENYLGGASVAGGELKDLNQWFFPNTGATNSTGFSALPLGYSDFGNMYGVGMWTYYWSTTGSVPGYAWARNLRYDDAGVSRIDENITRKYSVRCIKD